MQESRDIPRALIGIALIIVLFMIMQMHFTADRVIASMACLFAGIGMVFFPGAPGLPKTAPYTRARYYFAAAPSRHKLLWLLFTVAGGGIGWGFARVMGLVR